MSLNKSNSLKSFEKGHGKDNYKKAQLITYINQVKYIDILEQPKICNNFGLPYIKSIFEKEYTQRFYDYLYKKPSSRFEVFITTGIPEKYLCQVKKRLHEKGRLMVLYIGYCEVAKKDNIQILSTNPIHWNDTDLLPKSNQIKMF
jgi:predicted DNA-binding protein (UPF0278 family)